MPHQCTNCGRTFADGSKEMLSGCPDCGGNKFQFAPKTAATPDSSDGAGDAESADRGSTDSDSVASRATETVREWITGGDDPADGRDRPPAEPAAQSSPDDSSTAMHSERSWPSSGEATTEADDVTDEEFAEWPETARRPENRTGTATATSDGSNDDDDDSERSRQRSVGPTTTLADGENSAQADARSEVVPEDDLPAHDGAAVSEPHRRADTGELSDSPAAGGDQPPEHGRVVSEPSGDRPSIEDLREELNEQFESIKIVRPGQYELNLMELYNREEYIISLQEDGRYVIDVPDSWRDGGDSDE
ncbi:Zn-ribbon domain-containing protein [Natrinema sp. HArc-T2]|uniref:Zn-ribbon domain-containing protein n=1 Tax=Natrinema sp. HArc-T2 TaxID=3242701 RepID=UPI00359E43E2